MLIDIHKTGMSNHPCLFDEKHDHVFLNSTYGLVQYLKETDVTRPTIFYISPRIIRDSVECFAKYISNNSYDLEIIKKSLEDRPISNTVSQENQKDSINFGLENCKVYSLFGETHYDYSLLFSKYDPRMNPLGWNRGFNSDVLPTNLYWRKVGNSQLLIKSVPTEKLWSVSFNIGFEEDTSCYTKSTEYINIHANMLGITINSLKLIDDEFNWRVYQSKDFNMFVKRYQGIFSIIKVYSNGVYSFGWNNTIDPSFGKLIGESDQTIKQIISQE